MKNTGSCFMKRLCVSLFRGYLYFGYVLCGVVLFCTVARRGSRIDVIFFLGNSTSILCLGGFLWIGVGAVDWKPSPLHGSTAPV